MALFPIRLDQAGGEYMESVLVVKWHKAPGEAVRRGDVLVEVETAKAVTEIEAGRDGWLAGIDVPEGQDAAVGARLGHLTDSADERAEPMPDARPLAAGAARAAPGAPDAPSLPASGRTTASPYARRLARERNLSLDGLAGSGPGGRIKARDLPAAGPSAQAAEVPLVLLHGFGADRTAWHGLRALLPGPVIALDLPGHGRRADRRAASLADIAADLAAQLDERGIEEIHLVGHSLGGAAALALIASGRVSVRSLVLIAPAGLGAPVSRAFTRAVLEARSEAEMEAVLGRMVADPSSLPSGLAPALCRHLEQDDNRSALAGMEEALFAQGSAFDQRDLFRRLPIPVRVIWGSADRIIPQDAAAALPGEVALHLLPGIGHVPQVEAPALVARILSETRRSAP